MYNNNDANNNVGACLPPSIKLVRKQIKSEKQKEQKNELNTKNEASSCARKLFNN